MNIQLQPINITNYEQEQDKIFDLVDRIWTRPKSAINAKHSIDRWSKESETGTYFYILQDGKSIGITGYFIPNPEEGEFALRHHGITVKGTGRQAFDGLVSYLQETYSPFRRLLEFIPKGGEELIPVFERWGFTLSEDPIPAWEPKRDYYKYMMIREE